jgi:hypothetical protein
MKVNPHGLVGASAPATAESAGAQGLSRGTAAGSSKSGSFTEDRLELSSLVGNIARAQETGAIARAGYVKEIARLYRTGGYATDASALSQKLIQEALADQTAGSEDI